MAISTLLDVEYMKEAVLVSSTEGQRLLQAASAAGLSQYNDLQPNWENQIYGTHCGIASCVIVFNTSAQNHFD
ncbi:phytochelatin synthase family protein, partial [Listeria monocytogenes]|uniref:phytochelatin synthase family protein n=1 Tax=Listeria monocytogenes TaxID=1639 RepID=UPI002FDBD5FE